MLAAIETLLPALLSAARLLAIAAVLACLGVPRAAASVAALQLAVTMALRLSSHESIGGHTTLAAAAHAGAIAVLLMLSAAYPGACSLACAAIYVSTYAGLARGAPPRTVAAPRAVCAPRTSRARSVPTAARPFGAAVRAAPPRAPRARGAPRAPTRPVCSRCSDAASGPSRGSGPRCAAAPRDARTWVGAGFGLRPGWELG